MATEAPKSLENVWLKYVKVKWPSLVIGSDEYNQRRHSFFVGAWAIIGTVHKAPESVLPELLNNMSQECREELMRGKAEIYGPTGKIL